MEHLKKSKNNTIAGSDDILKGRKMQSVSKNGIYSFVDEDKLKDQDKYMKKMYDGFAKAYDLFMPLLFPFLGLTETQLRKDIIRFLDLKPTYKILEVSVGTGANVKLINEMFPDVEVYGVDLSMEMLTKCRKNFKKWQVNADIFHANASALPFKDGVFDAVLHVGGINSFAEKETALAEMVRVVKPGGKIVINDEGLSEARKKQWYSRLFIGTIFYLVISLERGEMDPPESSLPLNDIDKYNLDYIGNGYFWVMHFCKKSF